MYVTTVTSNRTARVTSTKAHPDVTRQMNHDFFSHPVRLSSYLLYLIKMSFHHFNESQKKKKTMALLHKRGLNATDIAPLAHGDIHGEFGTIECLNS